MDKRRKYAAQALAIVQTAAPAPNDQFLAALDDYAAGRVSLEELESNVEQFKYLTSKGRTDHETDR